MTATRNHRRFEITPESSGGYLCRARREMAALSEAERREARRRGLRLLDGLFSLSADEIPLTEEEQADLAAFEFVSNNGVVSTELLARIRRAILNVSLARTFAGLGTETAA